GPVLSGILGTPEVRLEYTVVGDTVNLASRLTDVALQQQGGGVVIDSVFRDRCQSAPLDSKCHWEPRALNIHRVKGKARDVEIYFVPTARILTQS
ncbi:MAG TPA: adenylate/guanylate cyclase domain-containing protein, partial [Candidatus Ozemobacteraceae bacterium]|nr:adenylate/guanylate cyclase domain-containing protein [Candidatus Ozemobacteraceae bacterium]